MEHYPTWPNLAAMMFALARTWPDKPLLRSFRDGAWHSITWGEFGRMAASCARHLRAAGVAAGRPGGDRVGEPAGISDRGDRADGAARRAGADLHHQHRRGSRPHPARFRRTGGDRVHPCPRRRAARGGPAGGRARPAGGDRWTARRGGSVAAADALGGLVADATPPDDIALEAAANPASALACLIYTSGTGGAPKGVMLPHRSILSNCRGAFELLRPLRLQDEVYLSYLPPSHSYEHTVGHVLPAQHRHRDRLLPRRGASGGRYADGAADHPHRGAARARGDPQPRADAGGAPAGLAAGAVPARAGDRPASGSTAHG